MCGLQRAALVLGVLLVVGGRPVGAQSLYAVPRVPSDLGAATRLPWEVLRKDTPGAWSLAASFPFNTHVDALHRMDDGNWLISTDVTTDLGSGSWVPADVVRVSGSTYTAFLCADAAGLPEEANVDAVFLEGGDSGDLILSFDAPISLGAATYDAADLLRFTRSSLSCSAWSFSSIYFDASAASPAIPPSTNLTGADRRGPDTIITFDVPTSLGPTTYLPGDLVAWNGASFSMFLSAASTGWPVTSAIGDFAFLADPGRLPLVLTVAPGPFFPSDVILSWASSCSSGAEQYGMYEGTIGSWYSHAQLDCVDDGAPLTETVPVSGGDRYYLVVPRNANDEGSYGTDSLAAERPPAGVPCLAPQVISACP